jgi:chemosensory pili system protein ChpE
VILTRLFASAFALGILLCVLPGALTIEALRRGLARGFRSVLVLELGSLVGDAAWAAVALLGAAVLTRNRVARVLLASFGTLFLFRLAWIALRDAWTGAVPVAGRGVISLANPSHLVFWLGVGGAVVSAGIVEPEARHFIVFFAGFMFACVLWCFTAAGAIALGGRAVTPAALRWVNAGCGVCLGWFGLRLLAGTVELARR